MIKGIHHVGLAVHDVDRAVAFLKDAAGLKGPDAAFLRGPNVFFELMEAVSPAPERARPVNEPGITHVCFQARDIEALRARFAGAGATFHSAAVALGTGNHYCYARDPERNVIEIEGIPFTPPDQAPWAAHVAIATHNVERLSSFYANVTGGQKVGGGKIGPNPLYDQITGLQGVEVIPAWIVSLNLTIELWQFVSPLPEPPAAPRHFAAPGYSHISFEVDDLESSAAAFRAAGAVLDDEPVEMEGGRSVYGRDPDGNAIELLELLPSRARASIAALEEKGILARMAELRKRQTGS